MRSTPKISENQPTLEYNGTVQGENAMWTRISNFINRFSAGWVALAAAVIFLLFMALVLPGQSAAAEETAQGAGSPDTSFFYQPADLYHMAEAYGAEGRQQYVRARFTFDLVFPLVYTFFLASATSWAFSRAFPEGSRLRLANLVPILGMLFDFLENLSASLIMVRYPAHTPVIDVLAPIFTALKWVFVGGSFLVLLAGFLALAWKHLSAVSHKKTGG